MGDEHGSLQNIEPAQLEETKEGESEDIHDDEGRGKGRIRERWVRFFCSSLNAKSSMLDSDIP